MEPALSVSEFYYMTEDVDHQAALLLFLVDLLHDQSCQFFLFGVQDYGIYHPVVDNHRVKRPAYVICNSELIRPLHMERTAFR